MTFALVEIKMALCSQILKYEFFETEKTRTSLQYARHFFLLQTENMFVGLRKR